MISQLQELWKFRGLIFSLVQRDLKVRYKNSVLGIIWSWLNPFLLMLVFALVFGLVWKRTDMKNYHIFVLSGLLSWQFFTAAVIGGMHTIVGNAHLLKKVYFPREILPISIVLAGLVNYLISLPVFFLLALASGQELTWWALLLPIPILLETLLVIGIALILSTMEVFYRDTHLLMDVVMQAWFFLTPIFYPNDTVPHNAHLFGVEFDAQAWQLWINPMASISNLYQRLLYYGDFPRPEFFWPTVGTVLVVLIGGYLFFLRFSYRFGEEV